MFLGDDDLCLVATHLGLDSLFTTAMKKTAYEKLEFLLSN